jgi:hypothetical protein
VNPWSFSRGKRLRTFVKYLAAQLEPVHSWQFELAAMLSQIGCITLPPDLVESAYARATLSDDEWTAFRAHPASGTRLLANIPRLGAIAAIRIQWVAAGPQLPTNHFAGAAAPGEPCKIRRRAGTDTGGSR